MAAERGRGSQEVEGETKIKVLEQKGVQVTAREADAEKEREERNRINVRRL